MNLTTAVQLLVDGLLLGGVFALSALGLNVIFGVMRVVNLAHGEFVVLAALIASVLFASFNINPLELLPFAFIVSFLIGAVIERAILRRLPSNAQAAESTSLLIMFGVSYFMIGLGLAVFTGNFRSTPFLTGAWELGPIELPEARFIAFVTAAILAAALTLLLRFTPIGRALRATSQDLDGALACGVDVERMRTLSFALGTGLAGASGCLLSMIYTVNPGLGSVFTLTAFSVIALGGLGSYVGTMIGALVLGVAVTFTGYIATEQVAQAAPYVIFIFVLLFRPAGLFGKPV